MKPLIITSGEPAGIGPDVCLELGRLDIPLVVIGDKFLLMERAKQLGKPMVVQDYTENDIALGNEGVLSVIHVPLIEPSIPGTLNRANAEYVVKMLEEATDRCVSGEFCGLVTAPVHKAVINEAGFSFSGHTEFLAQRCNTEKVVMMLASDEMKVALATTHLPLNQVSSHITQENVRSCLRILQEGLQKYFAIDEPRIFVAGLNPHAGENGYLGNEEIDSILPVIHEFQRKGLRIEGPIPADTMFSPENNSRCDAYLAMYHDQGLAVIKYASFGRAANITLGLPIIRTSVDHGTALTLAGQGGADEGSLYYAVQCAWNMAQEIN